MSELKTVWDAVNEFKGEWIFSFTNLCNSATEEAYFAINSMLDTNDNEYFICTKKEFNALVEDMTLGLDVNPVSYQSYTDYLTGYKTPLTKKAKPDYTSLEFWKGAPEGATHYWLASQSFYKFSNHDEDFVFNNGEWELCSDIACFGSDGLFEYPQSTPTETPEEKEALDSIVNKPLVYTQEMADNGERPSVGMKCLFKMNGEYKAITVLYNSQEVMVFSYTFDGVTVEDARVKSFNNVDIKPIDQRTKKEKAIDEFMAKNLKGGIEFKHLISKAYDEWVGE